MRVYLIIILGIILLLFMGCVSQKGSTGTKPTSTQQVQTTMKIPPEGSFLCTMERPAVKEVIKYYYDSNKERMRIENTMEGKTLITLAMDGYVLSQINEYSPMKDKYPNCNWVATKGGVDSLKGGIKTLADVYKNEPGFNLVCTAWIPDQKMFETTGKVCFGN